MEWKPMIGTYLFLSFVDAQDVILHDCLLGWTQYGFLCYRFFGSGHQKQTFRSSQRICKGIGANLVIIKDEYTRKWVGNHMTSNGASKIWTGMYYENASDPMWTNGNSASFCQGKWMDRQPDRQMTDMACVAMEKQSDVFRDSVTSCLHKFAYICERPACPANSFHCYNGKCVNKAYTCDNYDDCGDNSDETDCLSECRRLEQNNTGFVESVNYPNAYPHTRVCTWTIAVTEGSNVLLTFTDFVTEANTDFVDILVGGKTEATATSKFQFSGDLTANLPVIRSPNNFMIVRFMTDSTVAYKGFKATYSTLSNTLMNTNMLIANNTKQTLKPLLMTGDSNVNSRLGSQDNVWVIQAKDRRKIVTLQRLEIDLGSGDEIEVSDGDSPEGALLARYTNANNNGVAMTAGATEPMEGPQFVFSTDYKIYIIHRAASTSSGKGFSFLYWQGCEVSYASSTGIIMSPGYRTANYANYQTCSYSVNTGTNTGITLHFETQKALKSSDYLEIYTNGTSSTGTKVHPDNGYTQGNVGTLTSVYSANGVMHLAFKTNAILNDVGFKAVYSSDCPNPNFNEFTTIAGPQTWRFRDEITVSCKTGYTFLSEQFLGSVSHKLTCMLGGKWSSDIPVCTPVYCGMPPQVTNGYISRGSMVYGGLITYTCNLGFTLTGSENVTCGADKQWSQAPTCSVAQCPTLSTLSNGRTEGTGQEFGNTRKYTCDPGYVINGHPAIVCQSNSQWSGAVPTCEKLKCPVPEVKNGRVTVNGQLFEESIDVSCSTGYTFDGYQRTKTFTCGENETYVRLDGAVMSCIDVNECTNGGSLCSQPQNCVNTDGSYKCSCDEGYTLQANRWTCADVKECAVNNGGCDQNCNEVEGSYYCTCDQAGYKLFTADGQNGYKIQTTETGMRYQDVYRLNHTCIPIQCPAPPTVNNGIVLTLRAVHRFHDQIEYFCNLGYMLNGQSRYTCGSNKQWVNSAGQTTPPTCDVAVCAAADVTSVNPNRRPKLSTTGTLQYGEVLNMTCDQYVPTPYSTQRTCMFDLTDDTYKLMGNSYECQIVDCGPIPAISGSVNPPSGTSTLYGSSYAFNCATLHTREGASALGDTTVRCRADRKWDLGSLQCVGSQCSDPGTAAGTTQQFTKYGQGDLVTYTCERSGYTLQSSNMFAKECILNNAQNGLVWNNTVPPTCVDVEPPKVQNCASPQWFIKGTTVSLQQPTFTDNTAVRTITASPIDANSSMVLNAAQTVQYRATDFVGLTVDCIIQLEIIDDEPPKVTCPSSRIEYLTTLSESKSITTVTKVAIVQATTDNLGAITESKVTINPPTIPISGNSLQPYTVIVDVADAANNKDVCRFQIDVRAHPCSELSFPDPLNGNKTCGYQAGGTVFQCTVMCASGYTFYSQPGTTSITKTCTTAWNDQIVPSCVPKETTASYQIGFRVTYSTTTDTPTCQTAYQSQFTQNLRNLGTTLQQQLSNIESITATVQESSIQFNTSVAGKMAATFTIVYVAIAGNFPDSALYDAAVGTHNAYFSTVKFGLTSLSPLNIGGGCNSVTGSFDAQPLAKDFSCAAGHKKANVDGTEFCFQCPVGSGGDSCTMCDLGFYKSVLGNANCTHCPTGSTTRYKGSTSQSQCSVSSCGGTFTSTSGYPPCQECPRNQYRTNSATCANCQTGKKTERGGSTSSSQCLAQCPAGYYSYSGNQPNCRPCPRNYYQPLAGQTQCERCLGDTYTTFEGTALQSDCKNIELTICNNATATNPCQNGGTCSGLNNNMLVCTCTDGYYGPFCQTRYNSCSSNPCFNGGVCAANSNTNRGYTCTCPAGTTGANCETDNVNSCTPNPCQNGGLCRDKFFGYDCICDSKFSGAICDQATEVCPSNNDCVNGNCVPYGQVRRLCQCSPGWTGEKCDVNINDCASSPCLNGGRCTDNINGYTCQCERSGYSGDNCEKRTNPCENTQCGGVASFCVDDYQIDKHRCICSDQGSAYGLACQLQVKVNTQVSGLTGASSTTTRDECVKKCSGLNNCVVTFNGGTCTYYGTPASPQFVVGTAETYVNTCYRVVDDFWSPWYYTDTDATNGVIETAANLKTNFAISVCNGTTPIDVECQTIQAGTGSPVSSCDNSGYTCTSSGANQCPTTQVRYKCAVAKVFDTNICISKTDACVSNPCLNGAGCVNQVGGFWCSCPSGYTGSLCQHNVDDCASKPCLNGGTCEDKLNDFQCTCVSGYTGKNCGTNINECNPSPCNSNGVVSPFCTDLVNDYYCPCLPGYTDKNCSTNINECASSPCLHGGSCQDAVNDYVCTCTAGWTGERCELMEQKCSSQPCQRAAPCVDIFNNFFCNCPTGSYGNQCQFAPNLCQDANPCISGQGTCLSNDTHVKCACRPNPQLPEFKGDGCETIIDYCLQPGLCQNGGTCNRLPSGGFTCLCHSGYEGIYCQTNTNDCSGVTCSGGATCIDMVNSRYCQCPVMKTGANCDKDLDVNYDMEFYMLSKTGSATLPYPLPLKSSAFSVTLWVQFYRKDDTGTYFTAALSESTNSLEKVSLFIELNEKGVNTHQDGHVKGQQFVTQVNDGNWHQVSLLWSKNDGLKLVVDSLSVTNRLDAFKGQELDLHVWYVLGAFNDPASASSLEPNRLGFRGRISQVNVYGREVDFKTENPTLLEEPRKVFTGLLLAWNEYRLSQGVRYSYPSLATKASCTGADCPATKDREQPTILNCPSDIYVSDKTKPPVVTWVEPTPVGIRNGGFKKNYRPNEQYLHNKYAVTYEARDEADNAVFCNFNVFVQYNNCDKLEDSYNGNQTLKTEGAYSCVESLSCNQADHTIDRNHPNLYTCGPSGDWYLENRYTPLRFPSCGMVVGPAKKALDIVIEYPLISTTNCEGIKSNMDDWVREPMRVINAEYSNMACAQSDCSDVYTSLECVTSGVTLSTVTVSTITIKIPSTEPMWKEAATGTTYSAEDVMTSMVLENSVFDLSTRIPNGALDENSFVVHSQYTCPYLQVVKENNCVYCGPGNYYDNITKTCLDCPLGSFQGGPGMDKCDLCAAGTTTQTTGSSEGTQCKALCEKGHKFDMTRNQCVKCPIGFYQNVTGQFHCVPCPIGKTTKSDGAILESDCKDDCPSGTQLSPANDDTCVVCEIGFYRTQGVQALCVQCPDGKTTSGNSSTSMNACTLTKCDMGHKRVGVPGTCEACKDGEYQDKPLQTECKPCSDTMPEQYRTGITGATLKSQCQFFCENGYQQVGNTTSCEECQIGNYRANDVNGFSSKCQPCPDNKRTEKAGSTMVSECTILSTDFCPSGEEKLVDGTCRPCPQGMYKNNTVDRFMKCTSCPANYVTPGVKATGIGECTVRYTKTLEQRDIIIIIIASVTASAVFIIVVVCCIRKASSMSKMPKKEYHNIAFDQQSFNFYQTLESSQHSNRNELRSSLPDMPQEEYDSIDFDQQSINIYHTIGSLQNPDRNDLSSLFDTPQRDYHNIAFDQENIQTNQTIENHQHSDEIHQSM